MTLKSVLPKKSTTYKYGSSYTRLSTQRTLLTNLTTTYDPTGPVAPANLIPFVVAFDPTIPFLFNGAQAGGGLLGSPTVFDNVAQPGDTNINNVSVLQKLAQRETYPRRSSGGDHIPRLESDTH